MTVRPYRIPRENTMTALKIIPADDLLNLHMQKDANIHIDLAYARDDNYLFNERIYREDAQLFIYKALADIVLRVAETVKGQGLRLVVYDSLRTSDAQARMLETKAVKDNPHWLEEPRLLSPPGKGAHPRGMAVDCSLETLEGDLLDMGTVFDFLAEDAAAEHNQAHREHPHLSDAVRANRKILDDAFESAADSLRIGLFPLPQEWWDYRLPPSFTEEFAPLSDSDLPPTMRMCD